jgi:hypothetical protein
MLNQTPKEDFMNVYKQQKIAFVEVCSEMCFLNKISRKAEQKSQSVIVLGIKSRLVTRLTTSTTPNLKCIKSAAKTDQYYKLFLHVLFRNAYSNQLFCFPNKDRLK